MPTLTEMNTSAVAISPANRMRAAFALAVVADIMQIVLFPLFAEGAASPPDDLLDIGMAGALSFLLGWHWEFAPSFLAKLVPGVDFVPLWTLAVANVYRKSKKMTPVEDKVAKGPVANGPIIEGTRRP